MRLLRHGSVISTTRPLVAALVVVAFVLGLVAAGMGAPGDMLPEQAPAEYALTGKAPSPGASVHHASHGCCDGDHDAQTSSLCVLDCAVAMCAQLALAADPGVFAWRGRAPFAPSRYAMRLDGGPQLDTPPPKRSV